jgi:hypothetical protein
MTKPGLLDLREVAEADASLHDDIVARLVRRDDTISFDYLVEDHRSGAGVRERSVSWSLLRTGQHPVVTTGGAVAPFFAGLLPEGVRLGVAMSSTKPRPTIISRCCWRSTLTPSAMSAWSPPKSIRRHHSRCLNPSAKTISPRSSPE